MSDNVNPNDRNRNNQQQQSGRQDFNKDPKKQERSENSGSRSEKSSENR